MTASAPVRRRPLAPALAGLAAVAGLTGPTLAACGADGPAGRVAAGDVSPPALATVAGVTDGDTIQVRLDGGTADEPVRLIGIDTPETKRPDTPVECFGPEASARLTALLPVGSRVRLAHDVEARDSYDRRLAYVFREADGLFVNRVQVEEGYAAPFRYPPNLAHADELSEAGRRARDAGRGLWGRCGGAHVPAGVPAVPARAGAPSR